MTGPVVVVGDVLTDVVAVLTTPLAPGSDTPARVWVTGGGQAANTAAWLASAGSSVTLVAAVGHDAAGDARLAELAAVGVDCAVSRHAGTPTGTVVVLASGPERTMITDRGANLRLAADHVEAALAGAPDARHLHLSAYTLLDAASRGAGLRALAVARERGLTTSVDAASAAPLRRAGPTAFAAWVRGVDLLLANADEAAALAGSLNDLVRVAAVVKRGAEGAVWTGADGVAVAGPAVPAIVTDPTGAGDAFAAGLLAAWLAGGTPRDALRAGARLGAAAVARVGARPGAG